MHNFLFFIISILILLPNFINASELNCEINKNSRTSTEYLVKWINPKTIHKIIDNKIILHNVNKTKFLDEDKYVGEILDDDVKRLLWEYKFSSEKVRNWRGTRPRGWHKNDLFIMRFELRKSNNIIFFEGFYKSKRYRWVEGIGKCRIDDTKVKLEAKLKEQKLIEEKNKRDAELEAQRLAEEKRKRDAELEAQKLIEEKNKRDAELEAQKLIEEKNKRDAELEAQRIAEEKAKRDAELELQRLAEEKAKREARINTEKLAKEKAKRDARIKAEKLKKARKLAQEKAKKLKLELKFIKQKADNFYNDINEFVKSGGDLDLLELSELYDLKPNPNNKWTKQDLTNFKNLENFVRKSIEFNSFEENKIVERKVLFEQKKSEIILSLNNNLNKLNVLFRENFSVREFSKPIKQDIKKIKEILNNEDNGFVIETATIVLNISTETIEVISNKIDKLKIVDANLNNYKVELKLILRNNFGTDQGKSASKFIKKIENVRTALEKENLNNKIEIFLRQYKLSQKLANKQETTNNSSKVNSKKLDNKKIDEVFDKGYELAPNKQRAFAKLIAKTKAKITDKTQPAREKMYWINASKDLCSDKSINIFEESIDWVGYVDKVTTRDDGSTRFEVDFDIHGNEVQTMNLNKKFIDYVLDLKAGSMFNKGEFIKFSGYFKKGKKSENECLKTSGFDSNPELKNEGLIFRFTKIQKIESLN